MKLTRLLLVFAALLAPAIVSAVEIKPQSTGVAYQSFYRARVLQSGVVEKKLPVDPSTQELPDFLRPEAPPPVRLRQTKLQLVTGSDKGKEITVEADSGSPEFKPGEVVVVAQVPGVEGQYNIVDRWRLNSLWWLLGLFLTIVFIFGRLKGATSLAGLAISVVVIASFIVPRIIAGSNPFAISLIGATVIAVSSIYLAHGANRRSTVALISILITLTLAAVLAYWAVKISKLSGLTSEEASILKLQLLPNLNLQGLLLGGIVIGALGVLDDVTTTQAAAIDEMYKLNPRLPWRELYQKGLSVGREHIASLINTLALAYVGVAFPLFLLITLRQNQPLILTLNNEVIVEEIVRTLVGSTALILAVPISTFLAAYLFPRLGVDVNAPSHRH